MNIHDMGQSTLFVIRITTMRTTLILSDRDSLRVCAGSGTYSGGHLGSSSPQSSNRFASNVVAVLFKRLFFLDVMLMDGWMRTLIHGSDPSLKIIHWPPIPPLSHKALGRVIPAKNPIHNCKYSTAVNFTKCLKQ